MVWSQRFFRDVQRAFVERLGLGVVALGGVKVSQIVQARGHVGMVRSQRFFPDDQRAFVERLGLGVVALGVVKLSQIVQARGHVGMVWSQRFFRDVQRAFVERLGLGVVALGVVKVSKTVQARGHVGMVRPDILLSDLQGCLRYHHRSTVLSSAIKLHNLLNERFPLYPCALSKHLAGGQAQHEGHYHCDVGSFHSWFLLRRLTRCYAAGRRITNRTKVRRSHDDSTTLD